MSFSTNNNTLNVKYDRAKNYTMISGNGKLMIPNAYLTNLSFSKSSGSINNNLIPSTPTIGTVTVSGTTASVPFTYPSGGAAVTSYTVTSSPGSITGTGTTSPISVSGLTANTDYTFTMTATNSAGTSTASSASNRITSGSAGALIAAIPSMSDATLFASGEPGTFSLTVSGQSNSIFNGTYYMTGSHFYAGSTSTYLPSFPFYPEPTSSTYLFWTTRSASNTYPYGTQITTPYGSSSYICDYSGSTSTSSNQGSLLGEWIQIQCPNAFTVRAYSIYPLFFVNPHVTNKFQMLNSWYLLGANNSSYTQNPTNWTVIDRLTTQYSNINNSDMFTVSSSTPYNMYRIVITSMVNGGLGTNPAAATGQIQFYY